ncbi:MAG: hypothetical protein K6G38_06410 [Gammaproteobacteria bacterium]|nr:hypothetical protein [Gammaproteobacteria bacterium]
MASTLRKTTKVGNIVYLNLPRKNYTKEELLQFFTSSDIRICPKNSSKLLKKEDIQNVSK